MNGKEICFSLFESLDLNEPENPEDVDGTSSADESPKEGVEIISPLDNSYVLEQIFEHLGVADLKACRLVSKIWFAEGNRQLLKSSVICINSHEKLEEFIKLRADSSKHQNNFRVLSFENNVHLDASQVIVSKHQLIVYDSVTDEGEYLLSYLTINDDMLPYSAEGILKRETQINTVTEFILNQGECIKQLTFDIPNIPLQNWKQIFQSTSLVNLHKLTLISYICAVSHFFEEKYEYFEISTLPSVKELEVREYDVDHECLNFFLDPIDFDFCYVEGIVKALPNLQQMSYKRERNYSGSEYTASESGEYIGEDYRDVVNAVFMAEQN